MGRETITTWNWQMIVSVIGAVAALVAAVVGALTGRTARRSLALQQKLRDEPRQYRLTQLKQVLRDAKRILENPPTIGFDFGPKPNLGLDQIDEAISTTDLVSPEAEESVRAARDALFEVDRMIAEAQGVRPELRGAVQFRQRFPVIKERAISALGEALKAIGDDC